MLYVVPLLLVSLGNVLTTLGYAVPPPPEERPTQRYKRSVTGHVVPPPPEKWPTLRYRSYTATGHVPPPQEDRTIVRYRNDPNTGYILPLEQREIYRFNSFHDPRIIGQHEDIEYNMRNPFRSYRGPGNKPRYGEMVRDMYRSRYNTGILALLLAKEIFSDLSNNGANLQFVNEDDDNDQKYGYRTYKTITYPGKKPTEHDKDEDLEDLNDEEQDLEVEEEEGENYQEEKEVDTDGDDEGYIEREESNPEDETEEVENDEGGETTGAEEEEEHIDDRHETTGDEGETETIEDEEDREEELVKLIL